MNIPLAIELLVFDLDQCFLSAQAIEKESEHLHLNTRLRMLRDALVSHTLELNDCISQLRKKDGRNEAT